MSIHDGHRERLRERYLKEGLDSFDEHSVLELLLCYSIPREDTNPIAHRLINAFGSLDAVLRADAKELIKVEGVGEKSALLISLTGDITRTVKRRQAPIRIVKPADAICYCTALLEDEKYEVMYVISLNKSGAVLHADEVSRGSLSETAVYPRLITEYALRHGAHSIILAHNHPSGDATPSPQDRQVTETLSGALSGIGINLYDHIVVGAGRSFSMKLDTEISFDVAVNGVAAEKQP